MTSGKLAEKEFDSGIRLVRGQGITHDFPRHVHQSMLLVLITKGYREMDVSGKHLRVAAGSGFCLPPECAHACRSSLPHDYYAVSIPSRFLGALHPGETWQTASFTLFAAKTKAAIALRSVISVLRTNSEPMAIESALVPLLDFLQPETPVQLEAKHEAIIRQVRDWTLSHFTENVRLSDLAAMTGWSAGMVNRVFSLHVGVPPYEFLLHQRLREVARLLRCTANSLADIAVATGFADQSHMQRLFRRAYGVTPKAYRQAATGRNLLTAEEG